MSSVNKRILDTIEKSAYSEEVKELLKSLLAIELRHRGDKNPRYAEDYNRIIMKLAKYKDMEEKPEDAT
jgi:GTP cyclohydrolase FolE2